MTIELKKTLWETTMSFLVRLNLRDSSSGT
jgi:hypothetical protein